MSCGDGSASLSSAEGTVSGRITVFAAASLTDAFNEIARLFEEKYPGAQARFNFAGTPTLRLQLEQGARADIFASADPAQMDIAVSSGLVESTPVLFAGNSLVIITPPDNPGRVSAVADLARPGLRLVLPNPQVPAGAYSREMLARVEGDPAFGSGFGERVLENVVSEESNVKQVVAKVQLGEADAGIVYGSDVTPSLIQSIRAVPIPEGFNVRARYPIALLKNAGNPGAARAFIDFVASAAGRQILEKYGFTAL